MTEQSQGKSICPFCAVDVRDGAVFCFNCGREITSEETGPAAEAVTEPVSATDEAVESPAEEKAEAGVSKVSTRGKDGVVLTVAAKKAASATVSKVRFAVDAGRRRRVSRKKQTRVFWEPPAEVPGLQLFLVALGAAVASLLILLFTLYIR